LTSFIETGAEAEPEENSIILCFLFYEWKRVREYEKKIFKGCRKEVETTDLTQDLKIIIVLLLVPITDTPPS
jgi:hypothetical protein